MKHEERQRGGCVSVLRRVAMVVVVGCAMGVTADAQAAPAVDVSPPNPRQGDPVLVTVRGSKADVPAGSALGKDLMFFPTARGWQALFAVPLEGAPGPIEIVIKDPDVTTTVDVRERPVSEEDVQVDPAYVDLSPEKARQVEDDNRAVVRALKSDGAPQFTTGFGRPAAGKATSGFGGWRTFNGSQRSRHLGLDLAAKTGAPVKAINAGTVALVADTFLMGKVIVIDHGGGIGSTYFHLSDTAVAQGDVVKKSQRLGAVGDAGRTSGPHLHLAVWVRDAFVDPATFAQLPLQGAKLGRKAKR